MTTTTTTTTERRRRRDGATKQRLLLVACVFCALSSPTHRVSAFSPPVPFATRTTDGTGTGSTALFGTNRKARRLQQKQTQKESSRPEDAVVGEGKKKGRKGRKRSDDDDDDDDDEQTTTKQKPNPPNPLDGRPELSTVVTDEATGIQRIAQGKAVMDVVTRQAVAMSTLGPMYRLAQMFPGVPPEIRARHRLDAFFDKTLRVPEIIKRFEAAAVDEETGELPPHPNVTDAAIDFVLANRDLLGANFKRTLGRLKLRNQSLNKLDEARRYRALWKHFLTLEDSISAPFRQAMLDAETAIGPNFGNLDLRSYAGGDIDRRAASYLVLKGMVAHWEKKVLDADYVESTPSNKNNFIILLGTGDPKRYLPDPPIIFKLDEVTKICAMAQQMTGVFVNDTALFADLPVEVRLLEDALNIRGGTALRRFVAEEFCPKEGVTPAGLREGVRRLQCQLENMQIDPYGDLHNTVGKLAEAMAVGTDEDPCDPKDPYFEYLFSLDPDGPGQFQTYTTDADPNSLVRFLDNFKKIEAGTTSNTKEIFKQLKGEAKMMVGMDVSKDKAGTYVPVERGMGRPHATGWLDWLDEDKAEDATFEADNWREVKQQE